MQGQAQFRNCDRCGYPGLDSAGAAIVERREHEVIVECGACAWRQFSAWPANLEQEKAIEKAVFDVRTGTAWCAGDAHGNATETRAENNQLKTKIEELRAELDTSDKENNSLETDLRKARERNDKLQTRLEHIDRMMTQRTTALCSLLDLPDPRWVPKKEDME